jgi:hypothetical protein
VIQWEDLKPTIPVVLCIFITGFVLTALSAVSMRLAYHRAYAEIASSCREVSLLTVGEARYFCAPVARLEGPGADAHPPTPFTRL